MITKDQLIWRNVETLLKEKSWNLVDLAKEMEMTPQAINSLKKGGIGSRSLKKLSAALGVNEIQLLYMDPPARLPRPIPVISWVNAGAFADSPDNWPAGVSGEGDPVFSFRKLGPHAFGLRVEGDSMAPRYLPGDTLIIDPEVRCDNGSPCVVCLNGEVTFKLFWESETEIRLQPLNDRYPDTIIRKDSRAEFRVIGKVVDMVPLLDRT